MKITSFLFIVILTFSAVYSVNPKITTNSTNTEVGGDVNSIHNNLISETIKNNAMKTLNGFSGGFVKSNDTTYVLSSNTVTLYFMPNTIILQFTSIVLGTDPIANKNTGIEITTIQMKLEDSNYVIPKVEDKTPTYVNIIKGSDQAQWNIKQSFYRKLIYENIYDHIDLVYQINENGDLKYEFHVYPGGSFKDIKIGYNGPFSLERSSEGIQLTINQKQPRTILDQNPINFVGQDRNTKVNGEFVVFDNSSYGYSIDKYDHAKVLIIDPMLEFSTYTGGGYSYGFAIDSSGNVYVGGPTSYSGYPTTAGSLNETYSGGTFDMYISKLSNDGTTLLFSTFIGSGASGYDMLRDIEVDNSGNVYFTGFTDSAEFPTTSGVFNMTSNQNATNVFDAVVGELSSDGSSLIFSTYLGGGGSDHGFDIALDTSNNIYVLGDTQMNSSYPFPTTSGAYNQTYSGLGDVFVTKINSDGSAILNSTLIGGSDGDTGYKMTLDNSGRVIISGYTKGGTTPFPTTIGAYSDTNQGSNDIFVSIFTADLSTLVASTLFGGEKDDYATQIVVDNIDNIYLVGYTNSLAFPTSANAFDNSYGGYVNDGILVKLSSDLSTIIFSTYFGGDGFDHVNSLSFDTDGNLIIVGQTTSTDFPITMNAYNETSNGNTEVFIAKFNSDTTQLLFSTFFGGSGDEFGGYHVSDGVDGLYISGYTTSTTDFPKTTNSYNGILSSSPVFIAKFSLESDFPDLSANQNYFMEQPNNGKNITWQVGDKYPAFYFIERNGSIDVPNTAWSNGTIGYNISSLSEGVYNFTISVVDQSGNLMSNTIIVVIDGTPPDISPISDITYQMSSTGHSINWVIGDTYPDVYNITKDGATLVATTAWTNGTIPLNIDGLTLGNYTYIIYVYDLAGNMATETVKVTVVDTTIPDISSPSDITYPGGTQSYTLQWVVGDNNPRVYNITRNGTLLVPDTTWSNGTISIDVGNLYLGAYNYTLQIFDIGGNIATDSIIVLVIDNTTPDVSTPSDIYTSPYSTGNIINWTIGDNYPTVYNISRDGVILVNNVGYTNTSVVINIDGLPVGLHNFTISVYDMGGHVTSDTVRVYVVSLPVVSSPNDLFISGTTTGNNITWTAMDNNPSMYNITRNGTLVVTNQPWSNGSISINVDYLADGVYNYTIILGDLTGYVQTDSVFLTVDSILPNLNNPPNQSLEDTNSVINIQWDASDAHPDVYSVLVNNALYVDKNTWTNGTIIFPLGQVTPGTFNVTIIVSDKANNTVIGTVILVILDTTRPTINGPSSFSIEQGQVTSLHWSIADLNPGVYSILVDSVPVQDNIVWQNGTVGLDITDLALGSHNITLVVYDNHANMATWTLLISVIDTTPPVIDSPFNIVYEEGSTGNSIIWQISDFNPGNYSIYVDESLSKSNIAWQNGQISFSIDGLSVGVHTITIVASDISNNHMTSSVIVTVTDSIIPQISSPEDVTYTEGEPGNVISWQVFDKHPNSYLVMKDTLVYNQGSWTNGNFSISVDGLDVGTYNFKFTITDTSGNSARDTVIVTVEKGKSGGGFLPVSLFSAIMGIMLSTVIVRYTKTKKIQI